MEEQFVIDMMGGLRLRANSRLNTFNVELMEIYLMGGEIKKKRRELTAPNYV